MKIRSKMMIILTVAAVIPALIIIFVYQTRLRNMLQLNHQRYVDSLSSESTSYVNGHFSDIESLLFSVRTQSSVIDYLKQVNISNYRELQNQLRTSQIGERLEYFKDTYSDIEYVGLVPSGDGIKICKGYYSNVNKQCTDLEYVKSVVLTDEKVYFKVVFDDVKQKPFVLYATCVSDGYNENVLGYLCAVIDVNVYFSGISDAQDQRGFLVVDDQGNEIYNCLIDMDDTQISSLRMREPDSIENIIVDGEEYTAAVKNIYPMQWKMIFLADTTDIRQSLRDITFLMIELVLVFSFFAICSIVYFHYKINVPINNLTNTMNSMKSYQPDPCAPVGKDEIGQLGSALNHLVCRVNEQMLEIEQAEKAKSEYEIKALQAQINPHFLYNTLNAIKCLARLNRTAEIALMTEALIDLLRISASKERLITISMEVEYCKAYAALMSYRAGNSITINSALDSEVAEICLPKLSLQPIVENCILHGGLEQHQGKINIEVKAFRKDKFVQIEIIDDGCGMPKEKMDAINAEGFVHSSDNHQFSGIGIDNIRQRLRLEFGQTANVLLFPNQLNGTTVLISFQA